MIKQISITFDFNTETEEVTNIKTIGSAEKKARTTKKVTDVIEELAGEAIITLDPNKLIFNNKAIADLELEYEDRVVLEWKKEGKAKLMVPTIRKDDEAGNKVTKTNTVVCKGKANTVLAERGTEFTIVPFEEVEGLWKLVSTTGGTVEESLTLEEIIEQAEETEPELLVDTDEITEIDELKYKL